MKKLLISLLVACGNDHAVTDPGAADAGQPFTRLDADRVVARLWCPYLQKCDPTNFEFYYGSDLDACVDLNVDYMCFAVQGFDACNSLYPSVEVPYLQACEQDNETIDCSSFPSWTPNCQQAQL